MALESEEKSELVAAAGLAIDLDEPEGFIETLRRVASRKGENAHLSEQERNRWRLVGQSLQEAIKTIDGKLNAHLSEQDARQAQATPSATETPQAKPEASQDAVGDKIAQHRPWKPPDFR